MRDWLIEAREARGMRQSAVARAAGISQAAYFNIEHEKRGVAVNTAKAIAAVLGFDWTRFYEEGGD